MAIKINQQQFDEVSLGTPLLEAGLYTVKLSKIEVKKTTAGQEMALLTLKILDETVRRYEDGSEVSNEQQRFVLWDNVMLDVAGKATEEQVIGNVKRIFKAFMKTDNLADVFDEDSMGDVSLLDILNECLDQVADVKIKHIPEQEDRSGILREAKNGISGYYISK